MNDVPRALLLAQFPSTRTNAHKLAAFTDAEVSTVGEMLRVGDPLADALLRELSRTGKEGYRQLHRGLREGLRSLDNPPPALRNFLASIETVPDWISEAKLQQRATVYLSCDPVWFDFAMAASLVHTYSSPAMARLLVQTGSLTVMAERRLKETTEWLAKVMQPGELGPGGGARLVAVHVRLLHARIRAAALKKGWDVELYGVPISQVDLARTWLDFAYVPFKVLHKLGFNFTNAELALHLEHHWGYLAHVLGVDPRFYRGISTTRQAQRMLALCDATNGEPDENSRRLVSALLTVCATSVQFGPIRKHGELIMPALLCYVYGDEQALQLGIPLGVLRKAVPQLVLVNKMRRTVERRVPAAWPIWLKLRHFQEKHNIKLGKPSFWLRK